MIINLMKLLILTLVRKKINGGFVQLLNEEKLQKIEGGGINKWLVVAGFFALLSGLVVGFFNS